MEEILLFFLFILLILILLIISLGINIEVRNVNFTLKEPKLLQSKQEKVYNIKDNFQVRIKLKILNIIPIFKITITKEKIDKISQKRSFKKINTHLKEIPQKALIRDITQCLKIKEFKLKVCIGLDSVMALIYIIPVLCTIISTFLAIQNLSRKKQSYEVRPIFNER